MTHAWKLALFSRRIMEGSEQLSWRSKLKKYSSSIDMSTSWSWRASYDLWSRALWNVNSHCPGPPCPKSAKKFMPRPTLAHKIKKSVVPARHARSGDFSGGSARTAGRPRAALCPNRKKMLNILQFSKQFKLKSTRKWHLLALIHTVRCQKVLKNRNMRIWIIHCRLQCFFHDLKYGHHGPFTRRPDACPARKIKISNATARLAS
jgi:hypothetical protein